MSLLKTKKNKINTVSRLYINSKKSKEEIEEILLSELGEDYKKEIEDVEKLKIWIFLIILGQIIYGEL